MYEEDENRTHRIECKILTTLLRNLLNSPMKLQGIFPRNTRKPGRRSGQVIKNIQETSSSHSTYSFFFLKIGFLCENCKFFISASFSTQICVAIPKNLDRNFQHRQQTNEKTNENTVRIEIDTGATFVLPLTSKYHRGL